MPCFAVLYCVVLYTNPTLIAVLGTPDASDFPELAKEADWVPQNGGTPNPPPLSDLVPRLDADGLDLLKVRDMM